MKKDFVMPILVLTLICLIISGALAVCAWFTSPLIGSAAAERATAARREVLPEADDFELLTPADIPKSITEVYRATNGAGFVFLIETSGYGGDIRLICAIDPRGTIVRTATLAQSETKGLGSAVFEAPFESQFTGKDKNLDGVSAISGATISSKAYINAIKDALAAYESVKGGGK